MITKRIRNRRYRVIMLRRQGFTYSEIAEQLNYTLGEVKSYFRNLKTVSSIKEL
jgi:DNA-binding NarL/FixJ family response regulator